MTKPKTGVGVMKDMNTKHKKSTLTVFLVIRFLIVVEIVLAVFRKDYHSVFICALSLVLMILPSIIEHRLNIDLPDTLEIIIFCFIFAAEILGEINSFYIRVPHWDTILHTMNGFLCAAVGFAMVDFFNRTEKFSIRLSPLYLAIVAFCFSMTIGVLWEFFEFCCDQILGLDMQKDYIINTINTVSLDATRTNTVVNVADIKDIIIVHSDGTQQRLGVGGYIDIGIIDTMEDLFVNFVGAVIFSVIGYFYVKQRGKHKFASHFIPVVLEDVDTNIEINIDVDIDIINNSDEADNDTPDNSDSAEIAEADTKN
ncbi:MAG: hypothetical protein UD936_01815 [Acutalibacteraceae bacterium]|nr:hypothetical protein [Acutalibacteraceae bacterium]